MLTKHLILFYKYCQQSRHCFQWKSSWQVTCNKWSCIAKITERYKTHPSIRLIKEQVNKVDKKFSFENICYEDIREEVTKLYSKISTQDADVTSRILKENTDIFANFFYLHYNKAIADCEFPVSFLNPNISRIYKKDSRLEEKNYRPIR